MKYIVAIIIGAVIIGGGLSVGVYYIFGANPGYFFAKFVAAPVGLLGAAFGFVVYDTLRPRKKSQTPKN